MALFIRKPNNEDQLFRITRDTPGRALEPHEEDDGLTKLIVGLGNIGDKYLKTRHNSGFQALESFAKSNDYPKWQDKSKFKSSISEDFIAGKRVILVKPLTLYNLSGEAVRLLMDFYKIKPKDITIVHDELDLPFGKVATKFGGGSAGNNGIKSIASHIGSDFNRIRIGIGNDTLGSDSKSKIDPADFVLSRFTSSEEARLPDIFQKVNQSINI